MNRRNCTYIGTWNLLPSSKFPVHLASLAPLLRSFPVGSVFGRWMCVVLQAIPTQQPRQGQHLPALPGQERPGRGSERVPQSANSQHVCLHVACRGPKHLDPQTPTTLVGFIRCMHSCCIALSYSRRSVTSGWRSSAWPLGWCRWKTSSSSRGCSGRGRSHP